jgi:hypothetical protein
MSRILTTKRRLCQRRSQETQRMVVVFCWKEKQESIEVGKEHIPIPTQVINRLIGLKE